MNLLKKELCNNLQPWDFKSGNHIYLEGYHCEGLDFIVGCVGIDNKAISIFRPNNSCRKIEYIDLYKTCIHELFISLCTYEDPELTIPSQCVEIVDEISIERNPTEYHHDFCLRDLLETPPWSWQTNIDVPKLENGDKLVVHYFTEKNELEIRTLEMGDHNFDRRYLRRRNAIMYSQFQWPGEEDIEIDKSDVVLTCKQTKTGCYDFKLGNSVIFGGNHELLAYQFDLICGLQLVKADNRTK